MNFNHILELDIHSDAELVRRMGVATALEVGAQFAFAPYVALSCDCW